MYDKLKAKFSEGKKYTYAQIMEKFAEREEEYNSRTGMDGDKLNFGKYKGKTLKAVYEVDKDYIDYCMNSSWALDDFRAAVSVLVR